MLGWFAFVWFKNIVIVVSLSATNKAFILCSVPRVGHPDQGANTLPVRARGHSLVNPRHADRSTGVFEGAFLLAR